MKEEFRIKEDYGTKVGYTGKWLVQVRYRRYGEWNTVYIADSKEDAEAYITEMPDWVLRG